MNTVTDRKRTSEKAVALVTGASSGIGEATARLLAKHGFRVVLVARRAERLQALATEIEAQGGEALAIVADLSRLEEVQRVASHTLERFGYVDVLVNNAGFGRLTWLEDLDPLADIQGQVQLNLLGLIWMTQALLPAMIARRRGHIVQISSVAGHVAPPMYSVYAATKFGVRGFSEALRREVRKYGIRVSVISPAGTATEFGRRAFVGERPAVSTPRRLTLKADDVARAVLGVIRRPRREVILPWVMNFTVAVNALFPAVVDWAVETFFVSRHRRG